MPSPECDFAVRSEQLKNDCIEQIQPTLRLVQVACSALEKGVNHYLKGVFDQHEGLQDAFDEFILRKVEFDPDYFNRSFLRISELDFDGFSDTLDYHSLITLYNAVVSSKISMGNIIKADYRFEFSESVLSLHIRGEKAGECNGIFNLNLSNGTFRFNNTRSFSYLDIGDSLASFDLDMIDGVNEGFYLFDNLLNHKFYLDKAERFPPAFVVECLGSSQQFNELACLAFEKTINELNFDVNLASDLFKSSRLKGFVANEQSVLDLLNRTSSSDLKEFMDKLLSASMKLVKEDFSFNGLQSKLLNTYVEKFSFNQKDHTTLIQSLSEINRYPDRGFFYKDKIALLMIHFDDVCNFDDCIALSQSLEEAVEVMVCHNLGEQQLEPAIENSL